MPRPHSLPRHPRRPSGGVPFPRFETPEAPPRRFACVNIRREEKALFDALQSWWSFHEGRSLQQWEVFHRLVEVATAAGMLPPEVGQGEA